MSTTQSSGGTSLLTVITVVLVVLKITGVISISWWWVFTPLLIGIAFTFVLSLVLYIFLQKR